MGNLNKLDFDITGETFPQEGNVKFIDISNKKEEPVTAETEEDKYISFSADLIKCFKDKVKKSPARLRVDSLVDTYKIAEETYSKSMKCTLGEWCMANVNRFLNIAEGKEFNLDSMANIDAAKEDIQHYNLQVNFDSIDQLYIETRREAINNAITSNWMEI